VIESFLTIQGEGRYSGSPAFFIRVGGCDVGCHWCDVKESWDANAHPMVPVEELAKQAKGQASMVVVTGGEPLQYDMGPLTRLLRSAGLKTHLETSGAFTLTGSWDWICVSPKKFKNPLPDVLAHADELKVIIYNKADFDWALEQARHVPKACRLFIQPEWSVASKMHLKMVEFVKENIQWSISLQIHKYLEIP